LEGLLLQGADIAVPEIADYGLRRELIRDRQGKDHCEAERAQKDATFSPNHQPRHITGSRGLGCSSQPWQLTADDASLDADMILAAQAAVVAGNRLGTSRWKRGVVARSWPSRMRHNPAGLVELAERFEFPRLQLDTQRRDGVV